MAAPDLAITSIGDVCKNCKGNMIGTKDVAEVADWCLHCLNLVADPGRHDHICTFDFQGRATRCNYCQMQNKNSKECIGVSHFLSSHSITFDTLASQSQQTPLTICVGLPRHSRTLYGEHAC